LAVLATQSTTGILIAMILLGYSLLQKVILRSFRGKLLLTLLLALLAAPPVIYLAYNNVTDKLYGETEGSSWAREYDFYTGLKMIAEYPMLGIGFDHKRYLAESVRVGYDYTQLSVESLDERTTSNGLIYLGYSIGLPFTFIFLFGVLRQKFFQHRLLIGLLLILSLFGEAIVFTPFILMIIFSAFISSRKTAIS
jgi:O-antigen ligase